MNESTPRETDRGVGWPGNQWNEPQVDEDEISFLAANMHLGRAAARILVARGIKTPAQAENFLSPRLRSSILPSEMPGITAAADTIEKHIRQNDLIIVFGDFDTDGMTASAILHDAIIGVGGRAEIFIPDRIHEGCGVTLNALERCFREHPEVKLLVTVDCGLAQEEICDCAREYGVEIVVTDHHEQTIPIPNSVAAVVNPCLPGTPEELKHLCGAGVAFKLAHELARRGLSPEDGARFMRTLTVLAAVGTIGDLVPLVGENRIIASRGLELLNRAPENELIGLRILRNQAGIRGEIDAGALAFVLVPRINAAGRMGNPRAAIDLLRCKNQDRAVQLSRQLAELNARRREEEAAAIKEAEHALHALKRQAREEQAAREAAAPFRTENPQPYPPKFASAIVLFNPCWHLGIIGIVASRISSRQRIPSIVLTADEEPGVLRGSARCPEIPGMDLLALLEECRDDLMAFGGHRAAAGLTLKKEKLEDFRQHFLKVCARTEAGLDMRSECKIEAWIELPDANDTLLEELTRIGPFGTLNPMPLLGIKGLVLGRDPLQFGRNTVNWRLDFANTRIPGIIFARYTMPFNQGDCVDIVFNFTRDNFNALQFVIKDIRPHIED